MAEFDEQGRPKPPTDTPVQNTSTQNTSAQPPVTTAFAFNHPTIISLLYLSSCVLFVTGLIGLVLAYVWKGEPHEEWETSHYAYLIRTFWIGLIGSFVGVLLMIVLIGFLVLLAVAVIVVVRCVLSLVNAQKQQPMPNPDTWLI
ncbi:hypothetical protein NT2_04_00930 [Caenibius tardaugens NBRC 16725]|uniref:DUF4870 domain-containing protein n=1 Tax=Caenibius tardaugens NBRC 16725 TaxID=1219035 RepID=U2YK76_9SPHN|nr:hypothetical protein [Caenibius tardaugens]GAD48682.1 hypothetical protein NT2_04_00930 [Caenibius tardaugens NBRC 16725]